MSSRFSSLCQRWRLSALTALAACGVGLFLVPAGCHRQYYRQQADHEAYRLLDEKSASLARPSDQPLRIEVDRSSRMFNPFDLDFQPMPLDDPASHQLMQCVDGRRGYPLWDAAGFTNTTESPDWWQFLPVDEDGALVLDLENCVELALLHSPAYQEQLEDLYLAALAVSSERFEFDTQFFSGGSTFFTADGPRRPGSGGQSSSVFAIGQGTDGSSGTNLALQRTFATGSNLVVGLANSIMWQLSGPNTQSANTLINFALVQPLLNDGGRDLVLENLTLSERNLLSAVRSFERFRRSFYLNVTVGRGLESLVTSNASAANGALNVGVAGSAGGFNAGGYLGLLQDQLQIQNLKENIARLTENLLILEDSLIESLTTIPDDANAIVRQRLLVAQTRQNVISAQSNFVAQQAAFKASVDQFMATLGLPPYLCVKIEDPILEQFELIDPRLLQRRVELSEVRAAIGQLNVRLLEKAQFAIDKSTGLPYSELTWTDEIARTVDEMIAELEPLTDFMESLVGQDLETVAADIEAYKQSVPTRRDQAEQLYALYQSDQESVCGLLGLSDIDPSIFNVDGLGQLGDELAASFARVSKRVKAYQEQLETLQAALAKFAGGGGRDMSGRELAGTLRDQVILASQQVLLDIGDEVLALQLIQARARTESLLLPEVDIDPVAAFNIAKRNRRDYANAKALVVDAWRSIEVVADDLESSLDVIFNGDVQNVGNNPFSLRSTTGQLQVGLQWDTPITRLNERNNYRAQLILYEQVRRDFYQFEDDLWQLLRNEIRQLQANRYAFELGREAIRIAARQIELNADIRAINDARGQTAGPTLATDAISALDALLGAQNDLIDIYVSYEINRRGLDFDLGTMELTADGLWIDPGKLTADSRSELPGTTAEPSLDCGCQDRCGLPAGRLPSEPFFGEPEFGGLSVDEPSLRQHEVDEIEEVDFGISEIDDEAEALPSPRGLNPPDMTQRESYEP